MSRVAYVNGRFVPHGEAAVHVEDRGFQFADGVYEVWAVLGGLLADAAGHFERLDRSLGELQIAPPMGRAALQVILKETVRRNRVREGLVYLQVTRGVAPRDHAFPKPAVPPSVVCTAKTVGLLPNVLAKQQARAVGALEAWFVDDMGLVTEGASSNAWIIDKTGAIRTRDTQANILRGITRKTLLSVLAREGLKVEERPFTPQEAQEAREAFITGAGTLLLPIVSINGRPVGDGAPGEVAKRLRRLYIEEARRTAV